MTYSSRKITVTYMVMFALIFNAITSSVAYAGSMSGPGGVLLCTSQGYKWVKVDDQSRSSEQTQQHCKLCLFPSSEDNTNDFIADAKTASPIEIRTRLRLNNWQPLLKNQLADLIAQGRAPPINIHI